MRRFVALAGALWVGSTGLCAGTATGAADEPETAALRVPFGEAAPTPRAASGSPLAAREPISRRELRRQLRRELSRIGGASGAWVYDLAGGRNAVLFSEDGGRRRVLASNTKVFTTAAYVDRFGAEGELSTRVFARGARTGFNDRKLKGSLALVGDGDPALASPGFAKRNGLPLTRIKPLARAVSDAGIRVVAGNIRADDTVFDRTRFVPQTGITGGPYLSPMSGLSFDSGYERGRFSANPARVAAREFERKLRAVGVRVKGRIKIGGTPLELRRSEPLAEVSSPPASALLTETNKPSNNFFAEMLLKRLGARETVQGTTARGARKAMRFARSVGSGVRMENGSGLSRRNRASPSEVGRLLVHMARDAENGAAFMDSLAIAGRDGTLADRMRGTAAEGRCIGKTGTIDGVTALSGYCLQDGGIAFSILMNGVDVTAARSAQDRMVAAIARYR